MAPWGGIYLLTPWVWVGLMIWFGKNNATEVTEFPFWGYTSKDCDFHFLSCYTVQQSWEQSRDMLLNDERHMVQSPLLPQPIDSCQAWEQGHPRLASSLLTSQLILFYLFRNLTLLNMCKSRWYPQGVGNGEHSISFLFLPVRY